MNKNNNVANLGDELIGRANDILDYLKEIYIDSIKNLDADNYNYLKSFNDELDAMYDLIEYKDKIVRYVYHDDYISIHQLNENEEDE